MESKISEGSELEFYIVLDNFKETDAEVYFVYSKIVIYKWNIKKALIPVVEWVPREPHPKT